MTGARVARGQQWQVRTTGHSIDKSNDGRKTQINLFNQNIQSKYESILLRLPPYENQNVAVETKSNQQEIRALVLGCQLKSVIRYSHVMSPAAWKKATNGRKHGLVITPVASRFEIIDNF